MMFKEQLPGFPLHILDDNYPPKLYTSADSYYKIFIRGIPFISIIFKKKKSMISLKESIKQVLYTITFNSEILLFQILLLNYMTYMISLNHTIKTVRKPIGTALLMYYKSNMFSLFSTSRGVPSQLQPFRLLFLF